LQNEKKNLLSVSDNGINALTLIGEPATGKDFLKAEAFLKLNYGTEYPEEKFQMLWEMLVEEKWTAEQLMRTTKWFLKNKRYPNWTIADWFDYGVKLYPGSWYLANIAKGIPDKDMEAYRVNGVVLWKLNDGEVLPFERVK